MKRIVVTSHNPVKMQAALKGFQHVFTGEGFCIEEISVSSGVSDQPISDEATRKGAITRAQNGRKAQPEGDFWVGIEGGCEYIDDEMVSFAWVVILGKDMCGSARTGVFRLPREVQALVESGLELGDADDRVFGINNSKQDAGAVGLLTGNVITRADLYEHAVILALIPFKNQALYQDG